MADAIYLANPEFNDDRVTVTADEEDGDPTPEQPEPIDEGDGNSGTDPGNGGRPPIDIGVGGKLGDHLDRLFQIRGTRLLPTFSPRNSAGTTRYAAPETYATLGDLVVNCVAYALQEVDDQLFLFIITADATRLLKAYRWEGDSDQWQLKRTLTLTTDTYGSISAASVEGTNECHLAVANQTAETVLFYRFESDNMTIAQLGDPFSRPDILVAALATNGSTFVMLVGDGTDVEVYTGRNLENLELKPDDIGSMFAETWVSDAAGIVSKPAITWNPQYGFIAAIRVTDVSSLFHLRLITSDDGDEWEEFRTPQGVISQPTISAAFSNATTLAIIAENRRVYVFRGSAASENGATTAIEQHWFNGATWRNDGSTGDPGGGAAAVASLPIAACSWRQVNYFAWQVDSTPTVGLRVREANARTTTNTGIFPELRLGRRNFLDSIRDHTKTAVHIVPRGIPREGDVFRVRLTRGFAASNVLTEILGESWRAADNTAHTLTFDFGADANAIIDTVALIGNVPSYTFAMDDDSNFGSPSTSQAVNTTLATGAISSAVKNRIVCSGTPFRAHEFASRKCWAMFTAGIVGVFRILDNTATDLILDGSADGATGTVTIFGTHGAYLFNSIQTPTRYARITFPTHELPDDYYEVNRVIMGIRFQPENNYAIRFGHARNMVSSLIELTNSSRIATLLNDRSRRRWSLSYTYANGDEYDRLVGYFTRLSGSVQQLVFFPEGGSGNVTDFALCRSDGTLDLPNQFLDRHHVQVDLTEEV